MCGICGVVQIGGQAREVVAPEVLDRMTDAMSHRGPNDRGTYQAPGIALGVRRLSVIDVEAGHQPFANEDGRIWSIQNGEIYNHDELRAGLRVDGHHFTSRCDTEILPHLYERHGPAFAERLQGMFGVAVWDERRRRAVLVRDRLGIKPLYHARVGDLLVFASELKGLLASGLVTGDLDHEAIDAYLALGFVPGPRTPLDGVSKLMPGHRLIVDEAGVRCERYWQYPRPAPGPAGLGADHYAEGLLEELERSVRLQLMSDVPLGAMLSGGLDSSLIVALMARHVTGPLKTFCVGFREENEFAEAREVAALFGTEHHELELSLTDDEVDLDELVWHLDEPVADLSGLGFLSLCELASRHVTVALCGQGADELFGGYRKHRSAALMGPWMRLPGLVRRAATPLMGLAPSRLRRAADALAAPDPAARLLAMSSNVGPGLRARLARGPLAALDGGAARRAVLDRLGDLVEAPLPTALHLDAQLGLVDDMLHYFDRASMAHSLEVRVPFLDHHVVEYGATIPPALKVHRLETKHVLKRAAAGILPHRIIHRPKVGFFHRSVDGWFRAQIQGAVGERLLDPGARYQQLLDRAVVEQLVRRHAAGDGGGGGTALLAILMLEVWLSSYLPRALPHDRVEPIRISP